MRFMDEDMRFIGRPAGRSEFLCEDLRLLEI
jgi:hypothetical protein